LWRDVADTSLSEHVEVVPVVEKVRTRQVRTTLSDSCFTVFDNPTEEAVPVKQGKASKTVSVAVRVPTDLAQAFERVAASQERTVSAEIRLLMRQRVSEKGAMAA